MHNLVCHGRGLELCWDDRYNGSRKEMWKIVGVEIVFSVVAVTFLKFARDKLHRKNNKGLE